MEALYTQITDYLWRQSWQIAVLALVIAAVALLVRNKSAHMRYLLWLILLAKCLVPPLLTIPLAILPQEPVAEPVSAAAVETPAVMLEAVEPVVAETIVLPAAAAEPTLLQKLAQVTVRQWLFLGWVIGVAWFLLFAAIKALRVNHWLRRDRKPLPGELQAQIAELFSNLGIKRLSKVWLIEGIGQPFVWGLLRGGIYLPANFVAVDRAEHRRGVLGHELCHILRFDAAVNLLQVIAQGIFWFHPCLWWANRRIREEREKCCDEMAIARLGAKAKDYSSAIVNTLIAEHKAQHPVPSLAVAGPVKNIEDRIKTIMKDGRKFYKRPSFIALVTILLLAAIVLPTTLALSRQNDGSMKDITTQGQQIIKKMVEVNRYWLISSSLDVESFSYDFNLHLSSPKKGPTAPKRISVSKPFKANRSELQGIAYYSVLHEIASSPKGIEVTKIEEKNGIINLDFKLEKTIKVFCGNGISKNYRGYSSFGKLDSGSIWLDNKKYVPLKIKTDAFEESFSEYIEVGENHLVPLQIKVDTPSRLYQELDHSLHFDLRFSWLEPGLWLFDRSGYTIGPKNRTLAPQPLVASTTNIRINGIEKEKEMLSSSILEALQMRSQSSANIYRLAKILGIYTRDHNGNYPKNLREIREYDSISVLPWALENVEYLGKDKNVNADPNIIIAYDKTLLNKKDSEGTNVLYNDAHIAFEKAVKLEKLGITQKLKPAAEVEGEKEQLSFGSVKEFVIYREASEQSAIDFDAGTLHSSGDSETPEEFNNWLKSTGIDAVSMYTGIYGLCGFEMLVVPVEKEMWNTSPIQVAQFLAFGKSGTPANISGRGELPATYLFKTREDGMGVLQITGFSDDPEGVNIRYKMIEQHAVEVEGADRGQKTEDRGQKGYLDIRKSGGRIPGYQGNRSSKFKV